MINYGAQSVEEQIWVIKPQISYEHVHIWYLVNYHPVTPHTITPHTYHTRPGEAVAVTRVELVRGEG